jgi:AraC family transcriptional regulator
MNRAGGATANWAPLVYFWDGGWLGVGRGTAIVPPHAHHAIQITIGLDGPVALRHDAGPWEGYDAAVILPDVVHALDGRGVLGALIFLDPDSREGRWLRDSLRTPLSRIPRERLAAQLPPLLAFRQTPPGAVDATRIITGVVDALCAGPPPLRAIDPRIARALATIREREAGRLSLRAIADTVFLSPSRFAHLFTAEVGLPFRRYLLWRKLTRALTAFARGSTLSAAAHASGFADSAHLTRTWNQMFGIAPTAMLGRAEFYEIPAPFELGSGG